VKGTRKIKNVKGGKDQRNGLNFCKMNAKGQVKKEPGEERSGFFCGGSPQGKRGVTVPNTAEKYVIKDIYYLLWFHRRTQTPTPKQSPEDCNLKKWGTKEERRNTTQALLGKRQHLPSGWIRREKKKGRVVKGNRTHPPKVFIQKKNGVRG